ncbi:tRNA (adenosine(37)-N6)-threonylcarbamoyltransferase complex ATPase subunit type 1 TsaE [Candidatus Saccharibacteria bacterium]|nr:tRNA (adenosine(37)-N6)-threonylcarbamoyltransferase complex ATPase subunit type 1 TsaE [Candidatus Saccharibacteria bacterium]
MKITSEQEMLDFGEQFAKDCPRVIELIGDVGTGKTTFVRGFAKGLGIKQAVTSPSFTISKSYAIPDGRTLIHYDFYRLDNPGLMANDLKENLNNNNIIVVEWGNSIKNILPKNHIIITIKQKGDYREVTINNRKGIIEGLPEHGSARVSAFSPVATGENDATRNDTLRLFLDTSTPTTILKLNSKEYKWNSGHDLAEKLLEFIHEKLQENGKDWHDISEITFMSGPGSFTGLRIGAAVVNTLASELNIPLKNHKGEKVKIILPDYGRDANIGTPRK